MNTVAITAGDLRAAIARAHVHIYVIAARVRTHPITLSRILNGHVPLQPGLAERILAACVEEALQAQEGVRAR